MLKTSLRAKLETRQKRYDQLADELAQPELLEDQNRYKECAREYAELGEEAAEFIRYLQLEGQLEESKEMLQEEGMQQLAAEEIELLTDKMNKLAETLYARLLPVDPNDGRNVYLEIRAGTGGDEAALFAGDLYRMYYKYCEKRGWQAENISANEGQHGGYREIITRIVGKSVYAALKFESGAHRVQRVPVTEAQGRIHTSACTVAVLPELDEAEELEIAREDLRIDTYRSSGAGGQHVNTTDSAIRITHLPTGIVVECQDERSQHKNRARAMGLLSARINDEQLRQQQQEQAATRKSLVGSGDRSERIRTYNYPQSRVTDHRINLTLYSLEYVLQGDLENLIEGLTKEHIASQIAAEDE